MQFVLRQSLTATAVSGALMTAAVPAGAAVIYSGCTAGNCSMTDLIANNGSIVIAGVTFSEFWTLNPPASSLANIYVSAIDSAQAPGLTFARSSPGGAVFEAFDASSFYRSLGLGYRVSDASMYIGASNLIVRFGDFINRGGAALDGGVTSTMDRGGALAPVSQAVRCLATGIDWNIGDYDCGGDIGFNNTAFGAVKAVDVLDTYWIDYTASFGTPGDGMQIDAVTRTFFRTVPEPGALALTLAALLAGLGGRHHQRLRKARSSGA